MKKLKFLALVALALPLLAASAGYQVEEWNLKARQKYAEQRFGIMICWGIYASYAQGELYQCALRMDSETYGRMMYGFYPSKFDAREWVRTFKRAGAKYVTITARHWDGFSLWPTKVDDGFNIMNTPFKRDILGELKQACVEEGIQFNLYYGLLDLHRKDYPPGWVAKKIHGSQKGDYASYKRFMLAQLTELIDNYRPGYFWLDGEQDHAVWKKGKWVRTLDWDIDAIYDLIHSKKVLIANNNHQKVRPKEDIQTFELDLPGENKSGFAAHQPVATDRPLEHSDVIQRSGKWGYNINAKFRTAQEICTMIVKAAAKDANLLMDIGPDASGQLPAGAVASLEGVGKWMAANGHAIYGTRGAGLTKQKGGAFIAKTRKGDTTYVFTIKPGEFPVLTK